MKRFKDELKADIDTLSSYGSDPKEPEVWDLVSKTPEEIAAWCPEYERGNRRLISKCYCMGIAGMFRASIYIILVYLLFYSSCLQPSELCGSALSLQLLPFLESVP